MKETLTSWDTTLALNTDYRNDILSSRLKIAMDVLHKKSNLSELAITVSPSTVRAVHAKGPIKKGGLVLVPVSSSVGISIGKPSPAALDMGFAYQHATLKTDAFFYANPKLVSKPTKGIVTGTLPGKTSSEFLIPFWLVNGTPDITKANMAIVVKNVDVSGDIAVRVMTNIASLKSKDELLIYAPQGAKNKWEEGEYPPTKKAKH